MYLFLFSGTGKNNMKVKHRDNIIVDTKHNIQK